VELNRGPLQSGIVEPQPLAPQQVERLVGEGALLIDVRTELQFDEAHIPDAVCNTALRAGFGTKLAWIADREQPVVFVGRDDRDAVQAVALAASVGITNIAGFLHGGMTAWREERRPVSRIESIDVPGLHERVTGDGRLQILDVRERREWDAGHIPGSVHVPYHDIHGVPEAIDGARPVAVICASGQRSAVAASLLQRLGARDVIHVVDGGVGTWERSGWDIERGEAVVGSGADM
jgi:rhodanese-related sulfurtransferase